MAKGKNLPLSLNSIRCLFYPLMLLILLCSTFLFGIPLPFIPLLSIATIGLISTLAGSRFPQNETLDIIQTSLDTLLIGLTMYLTGGLASPFLFYYIVQAVFVALFFKYQLSLSFALAMNALLISTALLQTGSVIPSFQLLSSNTALALVIPISFGATALMMTQTIASTGDKLKTKQMQLETIAREKAELTNLMAHELRTPVASIKEYSSFILDSPAVLLNDKQKQYNEIIFKKSSEVIEITSTLLDISRIEAGKTKINRSRAHIVNMIRDAVEQLQPLFVEKNIYILPNISSRTPRTRIDEEKMRRTLLLLLKDAIKHTSPNSTISISAGRKDRKTISVEIKNQGLGINAENIDTLFDKTIKTSGEEEKIEESDSGLEMALCRAIIHAHGGRLWAEAGKRVIYKFTLPI
ncbi:MAG: HAMP domain-containing sensor histidine kinase [Candidatus Margulisiibacteriota bacterium]|nr:HAMP domain-containing histidine kinase [Candidatus Margulisiibacteriota bacterium]